MNSQTQVLLVPGPAGTLELAVDSPAGEARGVAVVAHPHPLFGGSLGKAGGTGEETGSEGHGEPLLQACGGWPVP